MENYDKNITQGHYFGDQREESVSHGDGFDTFQHLLECYTNKMDMCYSDTRGQVHYRPGSIFNRE